MRTLCPNFDKEDALDTVLEVPIPEEMFTNMGNNAALRWQNMRSWMKAQRADKLTNSHLATGSSNDQFMLLLKLVGSPLIPFQVQADHTLTLPIKDGSIGLDPRSTANLFSNAVCIGEKSISNEDCFTLKLDTSTEILRAQSTPNTEIVHHTIWGNFSQRTGLLIQFEDSKLVRMKASKGDESVFWETSMESQIEDYRYVEGINIAHSGKTTATIFRYGKSLNNHRAKVEETWRIEEVDFNIVGLSLDCFLSPADVKNEEQGIS